MFASQTHQMMTNWKWNALQLCFSGTATGTVPTSVLSYSDYISRPEEHNSVLRFDKGEVEKKCRVVIIDDSLYEEAETFNVTLSMPMGGRLGTEFPSAQIVILPDKDDGKKLLNLLMYTILKSVFGVQGFWSSSAQRNVGRGVICLVLPVIKAEV